MEQLVLSFELNAFLKKKETLCTVWEWPKMIFVFGAENYTSLAAGYSYRIGGNLVTVNNRQCYTTWFVYD